MQTLSPTSSMPTPRFPYKPIPTIGHKNEGHRVNPQAPTPSNVNGALEICAAPPYENLPAHKAQEVAQRRSPPAEPTAGCPEEGARGRLRQGGRPLGRFGAGFRSPCSPTAPHRAWAKWRIALGSQK